MLALCLLKLQILCLASLLAFCFVEVKHLFEPIDLYAVELTDICVVELIAGFMSALFPYLLKLLIHYLVEF